MSNVVKRPSLGPRVRGLRTRELPGEKLISLAYANTLDEFLNILKTTIYNIPLDKLNRDSLIDLRRGLIKAYLERVKSIYLGSGSDAKSVILSSLKFFEYENIRNLAVAVKAGKNPEDFIFWEPLEFTRRRHVVASLLGARGIEEIGERLRQIRHPAHRAFELASKYGEDKLSIFLDRQWVEDFSTSHIAEKDKTLSEFTTDLREYFNILIALRARLWGLTEELGELLIGKPSPVVQSAVRDPPARFLDIAASTIWGKILIDIVAEAPTLENIVIAMDNIYPAYIKQLSNVYTAKFSEFSLGTLAAHIEYLRTEVMTLIRAASLLVEGVSAEKRRKIFEPLTR